MLNQPISVISFCFQWLRQVTVGEHAALFRAKGRHFLVNVAVGSSNVTGLTFL